MALFVLATPVVAIWESFFADDERAADVSASTKPASDVTHEQQHRNAPSSHLTSRSSLSVSSQENHDGNESETHPQYGPPAHRTSQLESLEVEEATNTCRPTSKRSVPYNGIIDDPNYLSYYDLLYFRTGAALCFIVMIGLSVTFLIIAAKNAPLWPALRLIVPIGHFPKTLVWLPLALPFGLGHCLLLAIAIEETLEVPVDEKRARKRNRAIALCSLTVLCFIAAHILMVVDLTNSFEQFRTGVVGGWILTGLAGTYWTFAIIRCSIVSVRHWTSSESANGTIHV